MVLPVGHFVAYPEEKRAAPQVDPPDQHSTQMTKMAHAVARRAKRAEEFDSCHNRNEWPHGNHDRKWKEPDLPVREKYCVGYENAKDRSRCADGWDVCGDMSPKHGENFYEDRDDSSANSANKKIVREALFAHTSSNSRPNIHSISMLMSRWNNPP